MAYQNNLNEEGEVSEFNPAFLKMKRFGQLHDRLHSYRLNPKGIDPIYQEFGFILWIRDLKNFYLEIYPKISKEERDEIEKIKNAIEQAMIDFPVINKGKHLTWNNEIWNIFIKWIERYEKLLFCSAEKHGYDSPTKGEESLF